MSRSRKNLPIFGHGGASSEKHDKRLANRAVRRNNKTPTEDSIPVDKREVSDVWTMNKDGKYYWAKPKDVKRLKEWNRLMRKK